jgi:uncharacterized membrane protein
MGLRNPDSTATIGGHPIHPMLIPFPIVFFLSTLFTDIVFWATGNPAWATAGIWLLGAGILTALAAAIAGVVDFMGDTRIRALNDAWQHALGNVIAVLIALFNWYWRYQYGVDAVLPLGLILSLVIAAILGFTAWKGGDLVYKHRVAVEDDPRA